MDLPESLSEPEPHDEYLHKPGDKRLWNESYYFDFVGEEISGFTRLGYQPFERRTNVWFYLVYDERIFWRRNENIPAENTHGLHTSFDSFEKSYTIEKPLERLALVSEGQCNVADSASETLYSVNPEHVEVSMDLELDDPLHSPYGYVARSHTGYDQHHYEQALQFSGRITIGGEEIHVDTRGARDHSWGGLRNWTPPGLAGHYWFNVHLDDETVISFSVPFNSEGEKFSYWGYFADEDSIRIPEGVNISFEDDYTREDRGDGWATGDYPAELTFTIHFEGESVDVVLEPRQDVAFGYEDRNWELTERDSNWLKTVYHRMPVRASVASESGVGWLESIHPLP